MADKDDHQAANDFNAASGFMDWAVLTPIQQSQALAKAATYIRTHYRLRSVLTDDQQADVALARYLIARDIAVNSTPLLTRATANVSKTTAELPGGLKKSTEYAVNSSPLDPYPEVTRLLLPITVTISQANFFVGRQA